MNIQILLQQLISTMLSTPWLASEVNKKRWSSSNSSSKRICKCNKCKWCNNNSNSNSKCSSLILVVSLLNSSIARCSSNKWICNSNTVQVRSTWIHNTKTRWCNSNNSHNGKHSSNLLNRMQELSPTTEVSVTSALSNPHHKTTIKALPDNITVD